MWSSLTARALHTHHAYDRALSPFGGGDAVMKFPGTDMPLWLCLVALWLVASVVVDTPLLLIWWLTR